MDEAIRIAEEATGGKVVEIEFDDDNRLYEWEVELVTSDQEIDLELDAVTGEVIEKEYEYRK